MAWRPTPVFLPGESPWTGEPGGLQSIVLQRLRYDWSDIGCIWLLQLIFFFLLQLIFIITQFSSIAQSCLTFCDPMPGFPVHHQLLEIAQTHVYWISDAIQPSHPLLSPSPLFNLSQHQGLSNESVLCIRWPKYWSFSFSINPSNEYSELISFRIDWFEFLAVQGTLKSLLQYHNSKALILWCSGFFIAQLSHPYMTTGKTIALTRWTFVSK